MTDEQAKDWINANAPADLRWWAHDRLRPSAAVSVFGTWCPVGSRLPAMMDSVIVWGSLEGESGPDSHEGFLSYSPGPAPRWRSVRAEEDGDINRRILDVTHWMPRPRGPNADAMAAPTRTSTDYHDAKS